jgi:glycosyltransferase involved in cell wall biosynthesis
MIKITHLITGLQTGGAERMLARLATHMDRDRFSNTVISMTATDVVGASLREGGVSTLSLNMRRGIADPIGLARLLALLRRDPPTILQTWLYHADLMGTIAGQLTHVPHIVWNIRCSDMNRHSYRWLSRHLPGVLAHLSDRPERIIVNSQSGQAVHEQYGYHPKSWELIPNGFDVERFRPDPEAHGRLCQELGLDADSVLIGLPARLDPMKDHMTFLAAAADLAAKESKVHFLLIGRGLTPEHPHIVSRVVACDLSSRMHLLGERADMDRLLPGLDVVTLCSAFGEGFPNVLGEGMACGVPCVSTDVGDAAAVVGDTGLIVSSRDPTALAVAWRAMIAMGPEKRAELGAAARRRIVENFSLSVIVRRYEELYAALVGSRPAAA